MYRASKPAPRAIRADRPSYTPGAVTKPFGSARILRKLDAPEPKDMMTSLKIELTNDEKY
jgi:hypothetical protein